jgi:hypothetical protein
MSIFKNRRLDLKIQYIIIHSLYISAKWSRMVYFIFVLLHEQKTSIKVRISDACNAERRLILFAKDIPNKECAD